MKKYMFLLALVVAMSSTAWGVSRVKVCVEPSYPDCEDTIRACIDLCCNGQCTYERKVIKRCSNQIYIDVYVKCECLKGSSKVCRRPVILEKPCTGFYVVVVRVWCTYKGCACWPYSMFRQPLFCGMGVTHFKVCCPECRCFPCRCWMMCRVCNDNGSNNTDAKR